MTITIDVTEEEMAWLLADADRREESLMKLVRSRILGEEPGTARRLKFPRLPGDPTVDPLTPERIEEFEEEEWMRRGGLTVEDPIMR